MNDPTRMGPGPAPLQGGASYSANYADNDTPPKETFGHKLLTRGARVGAALTAPILVNRAQDAYHDALNGISRARTNPDHILGERDVMASLDEFLEKKAGGVIRPTPNPAGQPFHWGAHAMEHGIKGLMTGVGSGIGNALVSGVGGKFSNLLNNSKKRQILEKVVNTDTVISDAIKHNPHMMENLLEAYTTLDKFAPTLATDTNAVRSFMREVILGGGHVNYATIKNLVETEKAIHPYGGGH